MLGREVAVGARRREAHAGAQSANGEGVEHVVSVADKAHFESLELAPEFADSHEVGEHLTGVAVVGEAVDDGDRAVLGERLDLALGEGADHDCVDKARKHARGVFNRFAPADLQVVGAEEKRIAAELGHADLERNAGTGARFFKDHAECFAGEQLVLDAVLLLVFKLIGEVQGAGDLLGRPVL